MLCVAAYLKHSFCYSDAPNILNYDCINPVYLCVLILIKVCLDRFTLAVFNVTIIGCDWLAIASYCELH
jgi:hypothetical protein